MQSRRRADRWSYATTWRCSAQLALIIAITLLGGAAAAAYTFRRTPVYESTASVLVRAITTNAFDPGSRVDQQLNMFNQRQLAQSEPVAAIAAKSLKTTATPAELLEHVKVDARQLPDPRISTATRCR